MFGLFSLSMIVQLNDPDPVIWVALYGAAAALSLLAALDRYHFWPTLAVLALYAVGILYLSPALRDTSLDAFAAVGMENERQELVREFWGLIICAMWCGALLWRIRARADGGGRS